MKRTLFACFLFALSCAVSAGAQSNGNWIPESAVVLQLDKMLHQRPVPGLGGNRAAALDDYARYYTGLTQGGRMVIYGVFLSSDPAHYPPGLYIVDARRMPAMTGGGCTHLQLWYDVETASVTQFRCYGLG